MNYIQTVKNVPTKKEIAEYTDAYIKSDEGTPLEKYITAKFLESVIKDLLPKLTDLAREDFLTTYNGMKSLDLYGVNITVKDMSKSATLKDPSYEFSSEVLGMEEDVKTCEETLKFLKDKLKLQKTHEINSSIAKKLDAEVFPVEAKSNLQLSISLRK